MIVIHNSLASLVPRPSGADGSRELAEAHLGRLEVHAGVSDANAVLERLDIGNTRLELLVACVDVALNHDAHKAVLAVLELLADRLADSRLVFVVLARVGVGHVNHDVGPQPGSLHLLADPVHRILVVVLAPHLADLASAKDDVGHVIALGVHDRREPLLGDGQEAVRARGSHDGIDRNLDVAACAIFESDRGGQGGHELAVDLALGGPCANGTP
mmetsp:Transcript_31250/g.58264  ORF Transcript_31250/g.58264 Transcript_31250/m.58264 type:complete len:215 (-) Transcript_31250:98-742(-)